MKQEDRNLLLKDLSARLPYQVIAQVSYKDGEGWKTQDRKVLGIYADESVYVDAVYTTLDNVKPYLRPLSSMTEEEHKEYENWLPDGFNVNTFDWLNSHHFDYRGLISKGLAIEAPEGMYK